MSLLTKDTGLLSEQRWLPASSPAAGSRAPSFDEPVIFGSEHLADPTDADPFKVKVHPGNDGLIRDAISHIQRLVSLEPDWDSYGAQPLQPSAASSAVKLISAVTSAGAPLPLIVPTPQGGIQLEWHSCDADLELEITSGGIVEVFVQFPDGQTWEGPLFNNKWRLEKFLGIISCSGCRPDE
ncbi:MAG: hypothetical protein ACT4OM_12375 [Actinomycetota bacterium]